MKKYLLIILSLLILGGCQAKPAGQIVEQATSTSATTTQVNQPAKENSLYPPVLEFQRRVTKKSFGTYITPENSPISPERFKGYHTGIDVEYGDILDDVPVFAIADGTVLFSGRVNGYGGVMVIKHKINSKDYLVIYGHLDPASLTKANKSVKAGAKIAVLGEGNTSETDFERQHLHFAIYQGSDLNFLGYVQEAADLKNWLNPLDFYK